MQAVVKIGPTQYLVKPGDEVLVARNAKLDSVLLTIDGDTVQVGTPDLPKVKVTTEVIAEVKGDKLHVSKFKAKSRYRKHIGFRPVFTKLKITDIS